MFDDGMAVLACVVVGFGFGRASRAGRCFYQIQWSAKGAGTACSVLVEHDSRVPSVN